jgi:hypothetical protein
MGKYVNMGKFWRVLQWKMLVCFMDIWYIYLFLQKFGIFYRNLVYFVVIWLFSPVLV